jgi:hypothetical protein
LKSESNGQRARPGTPMQVDVTVERVETVIPSMVGGPDSFTRLGPPALVPVVPGDGLSVTIWNSNATAQALQTGIEVVAVDAAGQPLPEEAQRRLQEALQVLPLKVVEGKRPGKGPAG